MSVEVLTIDSEDYVIFPHPADWSRKPNFSWSWMNTVRQAETGAEERISLRDQETHSLGMEILPFDFHEQKLLEQRILAAVESGRAVVPYRGRGMRLADDTSGASIFLQSNTVSWPFHEGQTLFFQQPGRHNWNSWEFMDVLGVLASDPVEVELDGVLGDVYPAGSWVYPILWGKFEAEDLEALNLGSGHIQVRVSQIVPFPAAAVAACIGIYEFFESSSDDYALGLVSNPALLIGGCGLLADCVIAPNLVASVGFDDMEVYDVGEIGEDDITGGIHWSGSPDIVANYINTVALDDLESYFAGAITGAEITAGNGWSGPADITANT